MLLFYYKYVISLQPTSTDASYTYASFINISELYSMDSVRGKKNKKKKKRGECETSGSQERKEFACKMGVDVITYVTNLVDKGLIPEVHIEFKEVLNSWHAVEKFRRITGKNSSKKKVKEDIYRQIWKAWEEGEGRALQLGPFPHPKKKKHRKEGRGHVEHKEEKYIEKKKIVTFMDLERSSGPHWSEPIQIGCVVFSLTDNRVVKEIELNILPNGPINSWCSRNKHNIFKVGQSLVKYSEKLKTLGQEEGFEQLKSFIRHSIAVVCHSEMDFRTLDAWQDRLGRVLISQSVRRIDSIDFFKPFMEEQYGEESHSMKTLILKFGTREMINEYEREGHGALFDAKALQYISTSSKAADRFKFWLCEMLL